MLDAVTEGLTEMKITDTHFDGSVSFFISVPDGLAEIVETAAKRNGVPLERIDDDPAGRNRRDGDYEGAAEMVVPPQLGDADMVERLHDEALEMLDSSSHFFLAVVDGNGFQRIISAIGFVDEDEGRRFIHNARMALDTLEGTARGEG